MSWFIRLLLSIAALGAVTDAAFAQSYPSRATFSSAGFGCSPNLFASNYLMNPSQNGFICIGGYPNASGGNAQIYFLDSVNGIAAPASIAANNNGGITDLFISSGSGVPLMLGYESFLLGDASGVNIGTLQADRIFVAGSDFLGTPEYATLILSPLAASASYGYLRVTGDDAGTGTFTFGTWDENGVAVLDTFLTATYTESTGAFSSVLLDATTLDLRGSIVNGAGSVVIADDWSSTGSGTIGDDLIVADTLTVNGTSEFKAAVNIDGQLTVNSCVGCVSSGAAYGGIVDATGSSINLPAGWSVSYSAPTYTVTHNLALAPNTLAIACSGINNATHISCQPTASNANDFSVILFNDENGSATSDWSFTAVIIQ